MEQDKFIAKLQELADLAVAKIPRTGSRRESEEPNVVFRQGQELALDTKNNPTLNVKIKRLKPMVKPCEDCGLKVDNRVVSKKLYTFPKNHWRTQCENCRRVRNPESGQFDVEADRSQPVFISYFNKQDK